MDWKIISGITGVAAAFVANRLIQVTWRKSTGRDVPHHPEDPQVAVRDAVLYAVVSSVIIAVVRTLAARGAAQAYTKRTGITPAPFRKS